MGDYQSFRASGKGGLKGTVFATSRFLDESKHRLLRLEDGREYLIPASALEPREDGTYFVQLSARELERYARGEAGAEASGATSKERREAHAAPLGTPASQTETVIPALEEELDVSKRTVETGRVRVHKHVVETQSVVDEPLLKDEYEVKRVPVNRLVDAPVETRQEGDTTIVPLLEEVLIVEKRLILREEVHITKKRQEVHDPKKVSLRKEEVEVERVKRARS